MIPSAEECYEFMDQYGMLSHIKDHSIVVEKVANLITRRLRDVGASVSLQKVTAGALMHDIGKTLCLNTREDHAAKGEEICLKHSLHEIAAIVGEHIRLKDYTPEKSINEKEIVFYADKRVNHDQIVSLEERLDYLIERYAKNREDLSTMIRKNFRLCNSVEAKLFSGLSFKPEQLDRLINNK